MLLIQSFLRTVFCSMVLFQNCLMFSSSKSVAILEILPKKHLTDKVWLDKILREQSFKNINGRYRQYRLTMDFFQRRDFEANINVPTKYAYFEIHD